MVDIRNATTNLHAAQAQARAAATSAPCVTVLLGQRSFRLTEPLLLSAADSHTSWHGGEITTAVDVPPSAWQRAGGTSVSLLDVAPLVNRSEWGGFAGDANGELPGAHLSLLLQVHGIWRPMTVARWPNVPFSYGDVPPVNWTTISATCTCPGAPAGGCDKADKPGPCGVGCDWFSWANDTDRPLRWVDAAREGRLFVHGFFKYMWKDHFASIASVDVANRRMSSNGSIGGAYGVTNDSFYYAYGMREELDAEGEFVLNETSGELSAIFPTECLDPTDGSVACPTRLVPATAMAHVECCVEGNCSLSAMVRVIGATNVSFRGVSFRGSAGVGVGVFGSENVTLDACALDNHQVGLLVGAASSTRPCGGSAHPSVGSIGVSLLRSRVGFTGMSGASFTGGNRTTLTRARFLVENSRFHDFGRVVYTYRPGVEAHGVGVVVRKNEFRSSYHVALHYSGNDHLFELNEFHHVTSIGFDSGTIYAGRDLSSRGTVIRHNLFHHLDDPAPCNAYTSCIRAAVYIDDLEGGVTVYGNIFYRVLRAFTSNCGGDFSIGNNLFVESQVAVHQAGRSQPTGATAAALFAELDQVPFRGELWQTHYYPQLARFRNWTVPDEPPAGCLDGPIGNHLATNVVVNFSAPFYWGECECCANGYYHGDVQHRAWVPGFCDRHRSPGGVCGDAPNVARMFSLAAPWANSTAHFDVLPSNAVLPDPQFVSNDLERDLDFALKPTSPAFALGWQAIPQRDIGPAGTPSIRLRNAAAPGVLMPATGLGTGCKIGGCTWTTPGADMRAYDMTKQWLGIGGRRIDDADSYGLGKGIGAALRDSGVARSEVFLVSKTGPGGLPYPLGFNETLEQGRQIAANYSTPFVDLLLVHWPTNYGPCSYHGPKPSIPTTDPLCDTSLASYSESGCRLSSWRAMLSLLDAGVARAVGVSNFNTTHLEEIRLAGLRMPAVNQISFSPQHGPGFRGCSPGSLVETCQQLLDYCQAHGIVMNGYSPFGGDGGAAKLLADPRLAKIASRLGTTPSKVVLAWQWGAHGVPVNPEATALEYQTENLEFFDIELDAADVAVLDSWASVV